MTLRKGKLKNPYVISIISKLNMVILGFVNSVLISRYLGPELFGQYSYIINFVNIFSLMLTLSIGQSYPYFKKKYGETVQSKFINIIFFQLLVYISITFSIFAFSDNKTVNVIIAVSVLTQFNLQIGFLSLIMNLLRKNVITIYTSLINTFLLFLIFFTTKKNLDLAIFILIFNLALNSLWLILKIKIYPTSLKIDYKFSKNVLIFAFFPMMTGLLIMLNYNLDIIILERFVSFEEIGIYSIGVTLAKMLWIIPDAFKDVLFNKTAKNDSIRDINFSIKFNVILSIVVIIGFTILGSPFIKLFYGIEFISSYEISLILFLGSLPMIFFKMINTLYIANGKQKFSFIILFFAVLINIVLNYIFIPIFGLYGAAITTVLTYTFSGVIFLKSFMKSYDIHFKEIFLINKNEFEKMKKLLKGKVGK